MRGLIHIGALGAWLAMAGCNINTDTILGDQDAAFGGGEPGDAGTGPQRGDAGPVGFDAGEPPGDGLGGELTRYDGCDRTAHCDEGCDDDPFDCRDDGTNVTDDVQRDELDEASPEAVAEPVEVSEGEDLWLHVGEVSEPRYFGARLESGAVVLAVYDADWNLVARSTDQPAVLVEPAEAVVPDAILRVHAVEGPARFELLFTPPAGE